MNIPDTPKAPQFGGGGLPQSPLPVPAQAPVAPEQPVSSVSDMQKEIFALPAAVKSSLNRLFEYITDDTSTEITMSSPNFLGFKRGGQRYVDDTVNFGDTETYHKVLNDFIMPLLSSYGRIGETTHRIEGQLFLRGTNGEPPTVARVHIIAPPVVKNAVMTIAKKAKSQYNIDELSAGGSMSPEMADFFKKIAKGRATIIISGVSGSGKTTLLEAMSNEFDVSDRVILIEDTPELNLRVSDLVKLESYEPKPGEDPNSAITLEWLVKQTNRMRPDRIILGEIRGGEMAEFLTAANSGADGSITTLHAQTPQQAIQKMVSLAQKDSDRSEAALLKDIASSVHIIIQTSLVDGQHKVSQVEEVSKVVGSGGAIQTSTLFKYDSNEQRFIKDSRPSDELVKFLRNRGVDVLPSQQGQQGYRY